MQKPKKSRKRPQQSAVALESFPKEKISSQSKSQVPVKSPEISHAKAKKASQSPEKSPFEPSKQMQNHKPEETKVPVKNQARVSLSPRVWKPPFIANEPSKLSDSKSPSEEKPVVVDISQADALTEETNLNEKIGETTDIPAIKNTEDSGKNLDFDESILSSGHEGVTDMEICGSSDSIPVENGTPLSPEQPHCAIKQNLKNSRSNVWMIDYK